LVESSDRKDLVLSRNTSDVSTFGAFIEGSNISIGHLRIVAGAFDALGIAGVIERAISKRGSTTSTTASRAGRDRDLWPD